MASRVNLPKSQLIQHSCRLILCILIATIAGCGDSSNNSSFSAASQSSGMASAVFTVSWDEAQTPDGRSAARALDCAAAGIASVRCEVYDSAGQWLASGGPWACSLGSGTVTRIPSGAGRIFVVLAEAESATVIQQGQSGPIDLEPGDSNDAGEIKASLFKPVIEPVIAEGPIRLSWDPVQNAVSYRVLIASDEALDIESIIADRICTEPTLSLDEYSSEINYFWKVRAYDAFGNESADSNNETIVINDAPADLTPPETVIEGGPTGSIATDSVTFTFSGSDNVTPASGLEYSTYLLGRDGGWSGFSLAKTITYNDLPNGSYTFQVRARDYAGNEDPSPAVRAFQLVPDEYTLTVAKTGDGTGSVSSTPGGINCGNDCYENYQENTGVTLNAIASRTSVFKGWSGSCTRMNPCTVVMNQAHKVSADFAARYLLTVQGGSNGRGVVASNFGDINCSIDGLAETGACSRTYESNTSITLVADPTGGSVFTGWSGGGCGTANQCTVNMDQAQTITALFSIPGPPEISDIRYELGTESDKCIASNGSYFSGTTYTISFNYDDPDGDAHETNGAVVLRQAQDVTQWCSFHGDGFNGSIDCFLCSNFSSSTQATMSLVDGRENQSKTLTITVRK